MTTSNPVVRFAPSPTGHLHIGGLRTALFNYLFSKNQSGKLILRIEDTDIKRSSSEMTEEIIKGLDWLGIHWDIGPICQSSNFNKYKEAGFHLLEMGKAYRCFCTSEEIETRRLASGANCKSEQIYKYDRQCLNLTPEQIKEKLDQSLPFMVRFQIPEGITSFKDRIHKELKIDNSQLEDFVILKSDLTPTYHLSVVVDDKDMGITDVIRGDDHISNTFKQILLFRALGTKPPRYTHLPLILGSDRKKLSKRHGETSVLEFKRKGYLPEAILTYLSQLSWLPPEGKKIFSLPELTQQFKLKNVSKNSPVFDYEKLRFLNSRAIQQKNTQDLFNLLMEDSKFKDEYSDFPEEKQLKLIQLVKPRMKILIQFKEKFETYLKGDLKYNNSDLVKLNETFNNSEIKKNLKIYSLCLEAMPEAEFNSEQLEEDLRKCAEKNHLKAAEIIHPLRFALTAETVSPSVFEVLNFFGKEESLNRLSLCIKFFKGLEEDIKSNH